MDALFIIVTAITLLFALTVIAESVRSSYARHRAAAGPGAGAGAGGRGGKRVHVGGDVETAAGADLTSSAWGHPGAGAGAGAGAGVLAALREGSEEVSPGPSPHPSNKAPVAGADFVVEDFHAPLDDEGDGGTGTGTGTGRSH